jgi:hypothetical protein
MYCPRNGFVGAGEAPPAPTNDFPIYYEKLFNSKNSKTHKKVEFVPYNHIMIYRTRKKI